MQLTGAELPGGITLRRVCRHLEWVIMMFVIAHLVLGATFLLYGLWVLPAVVFLHVAAWLIIGLLVACALNAIVAALGAIVSALNEKQGSPR